LAFPFFSGFSQGLRAGVLVAAVCSFTSTSQATLLIPVSGTSAAGRPVAFTAGLTFAGDELLISLSNVSPVDSKAAADVLSSFYFDIRRGTARPPLVLKEAGGFVFRVRAGQPDQAEHYTPQTFVTEAGRASDLVARARGDGTWLFRELDPDQAPFLGFGIGTVGNSGLAGGCKTPAAVNQRASSLALLTSITASCRGRLVPRSDRMGASVRCRDLKSRSQPLRATGLRWCVARLIAADRLTFDRDRMAVRKERLHEDPRRSRGGDL
jgi:hypothetical protein